MLGQTGTEKGGTFMAEQSWMMFVRVQSSVLILCYKIFIVIVDYTLYTERSTEYTKYNSKRHVWIRIRHLQKTWKGKKLWQWLERKLEFEINQTNDLWAFFSILMLNHSTFNIICYKVPLLYRFKSLKWFHL